MQASNTWPTATSTYRFYDTTYTNASPSPPTSHPTTYTDTKWLPRVTADTRCVSATAYLSIEGPQGIKPACLISTAADINANAFWDVYECHPGHDMGALGYLSSDDDVGNPGICMTQ